VQPHLEAPPAAADPAQRSLARLYPRLEQAFAEYANLHPRDWQAFRLRLDEHFPDLFSILLKLYTGHYDFFYHLEVLLHSLASAWADRPAQLKVLDEARQQDPGWFLDNQMLGGVCYADLFAKDLAGLRQQIPYFKELGLTYLHLMPLFRVPDGENDGGYAISSYREVNPSIGTMEELRELAGELRRNGISLVLDFVFNHTSDEHEWALKARAGDLDHLEYYRTYPDREMPDAYERTLREIFPDEHPGAFSWSEDLQRWVWTTFHSYQWDLNYASPAVFIAMVEEMLALANVGVDALRLDAVAFIWKQLGTSCENLPEAHLLIRAFNLAARIAAPSLLFKSEAIVHPDEVIRYISAGECQLSYNPLLMALLWEALATRNTRLLSTSLHDRFPIPDRCAWVNYVRCHDDIGWTFSDEDAARLGISSYHHRRFLNDFYTGRFPGSFARGLPFQENPKTGDCRISGTCASLAGLEKAVREQDEEEETLAVRRILLIHGIIVTIGGIPLLYLGDETGMLNDYSFGSSPEKSHDSRWVHRQRTDWERAARRNDPSTREGRIYCGLKRLIQIRKEHPVFTGQTMQVVDAENEHILAFVRSSGKDRVLVLANFSEQPQPLRGNLLRLYGLAYDYLDLVSGKPILCQDTELEPYQLVILHSIHGEPIS
jgi:amylosucrase